MIARLLLVLFAATQGTAAFSSPEFMLCLHRDGHVRVEPFEQLCCRSEGAEPAPVPPSCPDENCRDLPVIESTPQLAPDSGISIVEGSGGVLVFDPAMQVLGKSDYQVDDPVRPPSFSGPPLAGPEQHLLTVVLRR